MFFDFSWVWFIYKLLFALHLSFLNQQTTLSFFWDIFWILDSKPGLKILISTLNMLYFLQSINSIFNTRIIYVRVVGFAFDSDIWRWQMFAPQRMMMMMMILITISIMSPFSSHFTLDRLEPPSPSSSWPSGFLQSSPWASLRNSMHHWHPVQPAQYSGKKY